MKKHRYPQLSNSQSRSLRQGSPSSEPPTHAVPWVQCRAPHFSRGGRRQRQVGALTLVDVPLRVGLVWYEGRYGQGSRAAADVETPALEDGGIRVGWSMYPSPSVVPHTWPGAGGTFVELVHGRIRAAAVAGYVRHALAEAAADFTGRTVHRAARGVALLADFLHAVVADRLRAGAVGQAQPGTCRRVGAVALLGCAGRTLFPRFSGYRRRSLLHRPGGMQSPGHALSSVPSHSSPGRFTALSPHLWHVAGAAWSFILMRACPATSLNAAPPPSRNSRQCLQSRNT